MRTSLTIAVIFKNIKFNERIMFLVTMLTVQKFILNTDFWLHNFSLNGYQANENNDFPL